MDGIARGELFKYLGNMVPFWERPPFSETPGLGIPAMSVRSARGSLRSNPTAHNIERAAGFGENSVVLVDGFRFPNSIDSALQPLKRTLDHTGRGRRDQCRWH
jgi:hypothetical protein